MIFSSVLNAQIEENKDIPNLFYVKKLENDSVLHMYWNNKGMLSTEIMYYKNIKLYKQKWFYDEGSYGYEIRNFKKEQKKYKKKVYLDIKSGNVKLELNYYKNKLNGYSLKYYSNGNILYRLFYVNGLLINAEFFDKEGENLPNGTFYFGTGELFLYCNEDNIPVKIKFLNGQIIK